MKGECCFNEWMLYGWKDADAMAKHPDLDPYCRMKGDHCPSCACSGAWLMSAHCWHEQHLVCEKHYMFLEGTIHATWMLLLTPEMEGDPTPESIQLTDGTIRPWLHDLNL